MIPLFKVFMNPEVDNYILPVLKSGFITQGPQVEAFEAKLKKYFNYPYILTLNSATSGLTLAIKMLNLPEYSEILICPLTCFATTSAILANNLHIKWVDVDTDTCNIDLEDLKRKITPRTRAVCFVHWGGNPVDMVKLKSIQEYTEDKFGFQLKIVEDCAHAFGAEYDGKKLGTFGNYAVFSLQAIKHLTTGDGGLIFLPNEQEYERAKLLRWFGISREKKGKGVDSRLEGDIAEPGYKFHMNDINASIGLANLPYMDQNLNRMRENVKIYNNSLCNINGVELIETNDRSACWLYTIKVRNKQEFIEYMTANKIFVSQVHQRNDINSCVRQYYTELPNLNRLETEMVCIPAGWWLKKKDIEHIIGLIKDFYNTVEIKEAQVVDRRLNIDKKKCKKIIICGWGSCNGSEEVAKILLKKGFQTTKSENRTVDYKGQFFQEEFKEAYSKFDFDSILNEIQYDMENMDDCFIKHGHLILQAKELSQRIDDVKFIICMRDPIDAIHIRDDNYVNFGTANSSLPTLNERIDIIKNWYDNSKKVGNHYILRAEYLREFPEDTIQELCTFVGCNNESPMSLIKECENIDDYYYGKGAELFKKHDQYNEDLEKKLEDFRVEYGYDI